EPSRGPNWRTQTDGSEFYRIAARAFIPNWQLVRLHLAQSQAPERVASLVLAALHRFAKALRSRDDCLRLLTYENSTGVARLLGDEVEDVLVALKGSFDAVAGMFMHHVGIEMDLDNASWTGDTFTRKLRNEPPWVR